MSSDGRSESAWHAQMAGVCAQSRDEKGDADKVGDSKGYMAAHETSLTERDYIGLSATCTTGPSSAQTINLTNLDSSKSSHAEEKETECRDTELRLGIGPHGKDVRKLHTHAQSGFLMPHHLCYPANHMSQDGSKTQNHMSQDGSKTQYRCPEGGIGNGHMDFHQSFWPWQHGVAHGRFMIPVPKVSTVPAKRPFFEVVRENNNPSICTVATSSDTPSEALMVERTNLLGSSSAPSLPSPAAYPQGGGGGGGFYAWSCGNSMPPVARAACQQETSDKTGMEAAIHTENSCPMRALPPPPLYKPSSAPVFNHSDPVSPTLPSKSTVAPHFGSSEQRAAHTQDVRKEDASRNKVPMVGWPPVRSFRKNTLQSAAGVKESGASSDPHKQERVITGGNEPAADQQIKGSNSKDALFVKAKLDGVRICRKVDLAAYSSYDSLKSALQEMFQGFVCNDNTKFDLVHGSNYVLTHEDKDGDWMLVGDVPWRMFVSTVKSLRIMKAVDAVGLGKGTDQSQRS